MSPEELYCKRTEKPPTITITPDLIKSLNSTTSRKNGVIHPDNNNNNDLDSSPVPKDAYSDPDDIIIPTQMQMMEVKMSMTLLTSLWNCPCLSNMKVPRNLMTKICMLLSTSNFSSSQVIL